MSKQKDQFIALLGELFQLNQPELDFGLYRILHARSAQIKAFIDTELASEIDAHFAEQSQSNAHDSLEAARVKVAETLGEDAFLPTGELKPEYRGTKVGKEFELAQQQARDGGGVLADDAQVYEHLYRFFSRYYDKGDFMSKRYFVAENDSRAAPYAVPYDGREVMLHWANKDQYYIKSSEALSNFTFDLSTAQAKEQGQQSGFDFQPAHATPLKVHFRLAAAAEDEHGNIKESQERFFIIHASQALKLEVNEQGQTELVVQFDYRPDTDKSGQAGTWQQKRLAEAEQVIAEQLENLVFPHPELRAFQELLFAPAPTDKQPNRTLLGKYLGQFTARNTMDYFIHKNLGGFLRRELDFYIKNEIIRLDDIEAADAPRVDEYLKKLRVLRKIARRIIDFLAQLEDFQKKLWLKKKFVFETQYCITLDRIPESFYPEIAANEEQRKEWVKLFTIDEIKTDAAQPGYSEPLSVEFLKANKFLTIDTRHFDTNQKEKILATQSELDNSHNGVIIQSDNFQALSLAKQKLSQQVKLIYIDPPYNTGGDDFVYKDNYRHSSWCSMQADRLGIAKDLLSSSAGIICNLNDIEDWRYRGIVESSLGDGSYITTVTTKCSTASSFRTVNLGPVDISDRLIFAAKNRESYSYTTSYVTKPVDLAHFSRFIVNPEQDCSLWEFKPIKIQVLQDLGFPCENSASGMKLARQKWGDAAHSIVENACEQFAIKNADRVFETKTLQKPAPWLRDYIEKSKTKKDQVIPVERDTSETMYLLGGRQFYFLSKSIRTVDGIKAVAEPASTIWMDIDTNNLKHEGAVDFPLGKKPIKLISRLIEMTQNAEGNYILDYFAGSGSTGHAVISTNRKNNYNNKYALFEMGHHFSSVLLPRIKKSIYSTTWRNEKPISRDGTSHCFKYLRLESFEDTLNNLQLPDTPRLNISATDSSEMARDYLLKYWLEFETAGSPSLLNVREFSDPTSYKLKVKQPGSDAQVEKTIDLVETFNWLIGLHVAHLDQPRRYAIELVRETDPELPQDQDTRWRSTSIKEREDGEFWFRAVEGHIFREPGDDSSLERVLVIWRKLTGNSGRDQAALEAWLGKRGINPRESEFATIYVNGNHAPPSDGDAAMRVRLIEETFAQRMWEDA
ncbi:TPA: site-specific DNA-methyltransferase [Pseudomonas aeruginosa]|nr:site-specific DNA-methyltransferase [Pseudomonas aeruginosa]